MILLSKRKIEKFRKSRLKYIWHTQLEHTAQKVNAQTNRENLQNAVNSDTRKTMSVQREDKTHPRRG